MMLMQLQLLTIKTAADTRAEDIPERCYRKQQGLPSTEKTASLRLPPHFIEVMAISINLDLLNNF